MEYKVERVGESLTARLVDGIPREISLTHREPSGNETYLTIRNGLRVKESGRYAKGIENFDHGVTAYLRASAELGPGLRAQIPQEWHEVLGLWLQAKK